MMRFTLPRRRALAILATATSLYACGGGGASQLSEPTPPDAGTPAGPPPPGSPPPTPPSGPPPAAPSLVTIITPDRTFSPAEVRLAAGGTVTWQAIGDRHDIRFVGATPPDGNIGELDEGTSASRGFPAPGRYDFECLRHRDRGMRGSVIVEAASSQPPANPPDSPPAGSNATVATPNATFSPANVTIPAGGSVTWQFSQARHNVTFQGTAPAGGNVPDQDPGTSASRTFALPGTYNYVCTRHAGMTGRVTVQ
jgi:plastocyanin